MVKYQCEINKIIDTVKEATEHKYSQFILESDLNNILTEFRRVAYNEGFEEGYQEHKSEVEDYL